MDKPITRRVLAIEVRSRKIGYVAFEKNRTLIDWGARSFARTHRFAVPFVLAKLLQSLNPGLVLLSPANKQNQQSAGSIRDFVRIARRVATSLSIQTKLVNKDFVRAHYLGTGRIDKYDIARRVVGYFPELAWHIPKKRKPWQGEPATQVVFDAATVAVFLLETQCTDENQCPLAGSRR